MKINITDEFNLYKKHSFVFNNGVTILVGKNGSGKTTLLNLIVNFCEQNKYAYLKYDNLTNGGINAKSKYIFHNNIELLCRCMCSSEGENIIINIAQQAQKMGCFVNKHRNETMFILLDAIDSGLSIDSIYQIKHDLINTILKDTENNELYIIICANNYELAKDYDCIDVFTGKHITFKTYQEFYNFIMKDYDKSDELNNNL